VSATSQCPAVVPVSATSQCPAVVPVSAAISAIYQYPSSVSPISAAYQCCILVPPIRDTSLVLPISATYPCHLISTAYQCPLVLPISAHQCRLSVLPHQRTSVKEKNYLFEKFYNRNKETFFFFFSKFFALFCL
ncbi:unnamed protein product, partial [Staurois parvus]